MQDCSSSFWARWQELIEVPLTVNIYNPFHVARLLKIHIRSPLTLKGRHNLYCLNLWPALTASCCERRAEGETTARTSNNQHIKFSAFLFPNVENRDAKPPRNSHELKELTENIHKKTGCRCGPRSVCPVVSVHEQSSVSQSQKINEFPVREKKKINTNWKSLSITSFLLVVVVNGTISRVGAQHLLSSQDKWSYSVFLLLSTNPPNSEHILYTQAAGLVSHSVLIHKINLSELRSTNPNNSLLVCSERFSFLFVLQQ